MRMRWDPRLTGLKPRRYKREGKRWVRWPTLAGCGESVDRGKPGRYSRRVPPARSDQAGLAEQSEWSQMGQGIGMNRGVAYRKLWGYRPCRVAVIVMLTAWTAGARAQEAAPAASPEKPAATGTQQPTAKPNPEAKTDSKAEVASHDTATTFKLRVNTLA